MAYAIKLFGEVEFSGVAEGILRAVAEQINGENPDYLLNVNQTQYVQHVVDKHRFDPLIIHFDQIEASPTERSVPAERFPSAQFFVERGQQYTKPAFIYHLPFEGDPNMLKCAPSPRILNTYRIQVDKGEMSFEIIDFFGKPEEIKREADSILKYAREQSGYLDENIRKFNETLSATVKKRFEERKAKLLQQGQLAASLGVPIRKSPNVPKTFAVPAAVRKVITPRPASSAGPYPSRKDCRFAGFVPAKTNTTDLKENEGSRSPIGSCPLQAGGASLNDAASTPTAV